jgi:TonB family protein
MHYDGGGIWHGMSSEALSLTAESIDAFDAHAASRAPPPPLFWIALACAALLHAAFIVGFGRSTPRYLGDPGGSADAIDVELVDEADLRERTTKPNRPAAPPGSPAPVSPPAAPQTPPPQPAPEVKQPPPPDKAPPPEPETAKAPETAPAPQQKQKSEVPTLETTPQEALPDTSTPEAIIKEARKAEAKRKSAAKPAPKPAPKLPTQLDLSVPFDMTMGGTSGSDGSSSATRPSGITRSGENDRFGRDVISALKKMMPPARGMHGRVVIRLVLNERGNVANVTILESSGDRNLDHDVAFSAYQASFPFPPKGATLVDRTFRVGYTYR